MALSFHYGAGSPFAWRVWLALEHKRIAYTLRSWSFSSAELRGPEFTDLNPRQRVPVVSDEHFRLYESAAILEYLEDAYPASGEPLFPGTPRERAIMRRMVCEADQYFWPPLARLLQRVLFSSEAEWKASKIAASRDECVRELELRASHMQGDFLAGPLSAADFALYPMVAIAKRCEKKKPDLGLEAAIPIGLRTWMDRIERLAYFPKTWPAHWT